MGQARPEVLVDAGCGAIAGVIARKVGVHRVTTANLDSLSDHDLVKTAADSAVLVLGRRALGGSPARLLVRRMRERLPHVTFLLCVAFDAEHNDRIVEYARGGVDGVFDLTSSRSGVVGTDLDRFLESIRLRLRCPAPEFELRMAHDALRQSDVASLVMYCLRNGPSEVDVRSVAKVFDVPARTLSDRLRRDMLPGCDALIRTGWHLTVLESGRRHPEWSREWLARWSGYHTAAAMRLDRWRLCRTLARDGDFGRLLRGLLGSMLSSLG